MADDDEEDKYAHLLNSNGKKNSTLQEIRLKLPEISEAISDIASRNKDAATQHYCSPVGVSFCSRGSCNHGSSSLPSPFNPSDQSSDLSDFDDGNSESSEESAVLIDRGVKQGSHYQYSMLLNKKVFD